MEVVIIMLSIANEVIFSVYLHGLNKSLLYC